MFVGEEESFFSAMPPGTSTASQSFQRKSIAKSVCAPFPQRVPRLNPRDLQAPLPEYAAKGVENHVTEVSEASDYRTLPLTYDGGPDDRCECSTLEQTIEDCPHWVAVENPEDGADGSLNGALATRVRLVHGDGDDGDDDEVCSAGAVERDPSHSVAAKCSKGPKGLSKNKSLRVNVHEAQAMFLFDIESEVYCLHSRAAAKGANVNRSGELLFGTYPTTRTILSPHLIHLLHVGERVQQL